jgi:hypothetical protein
MVGLVVARPSEPPAGIAEMIAAASAPLAAAAAVIRAMRSR